MESQQNHNSHNEDFVSFQKQACIALRDISVALRDHFYNSEARTLSQTAGFRAKELGVSMRAMDRGDTATAKAECPSPSAIQELVAQTNRWLNDNGHEQLQSSFTAHTPRHSAKPAPKQAQHSDDEPQQPATAPRNEPVQSQPEPDPVPDPEPEQPQQYAEQPQPAQEQSSKMSKDVDKLKNDVGSLQDAVRGLINYRDKSDKDFKAAFTCIDALEGVSKTALERIEALEAIVEKNFDPEFDDKLRRNRTMKAFELKLGQNRKGLDQESKSPLQVRADKFPPVHEGTAAPATSH